MKKINILCHTSPKRSPSMKYLTISRFSDSKLKESPLLIDSHIEDPIKKDKIAVTSLTKDSYYEWRSGKSGSNHLKIESSLAEFQDNYLIGKYRKNNPKNKEDNINIINDNKFKKNENDNKKLLEKLEKRSLSYDPEINLFQLVQDITRGLDCDSKNISLK